MLLLHTYTLCHTQSWNGIQLHLQVCYLWQSPTPHQGHCYIQPIRDPNSLNSNFFSKHTITEEAFCCYWRYTVYLFLFTPATFPQDKARLTTVAAPRASAWLSIVPNNNLGLYLTTHECMESCDQVVDCCWYKPWGFQMPFLSRTSRQICKDIMPH